MTKKQLGSLLLTASSVLLLSGCPGLTPGSTATQGAQTDSIKKTVTSLKSDIQNLKGSFTGLASSYTTILTSLSSPAHLNAYRTLGTVSANGVTIDWDDTSKQLTRIADATNEFTFAFTKNENTRTATFGIAKSADNTTGNCTLNVTATTWNPTDADAETPPPFEFWYNDMPDMASVTAASAKLTMVPQGLEANKMEVEVGADTLAELGLTVATSSENPFNPFEGKIFTHYTLKGYVPMLTFDNDVTLRKAGTSLLEVTYGGSFTTQVEGKTESWTAAATLTTDVSKDNDGQLAFTLTNTTQGYKLAGTLQPKGDQVVFNAKFTPSSSDTELATIVYDPATGIVVPKITYADGTSENLVI